LRGDTPGGIEVCLGGLVCHQLEGAQQTDAPRFADHRIVAKRVKPFEEARADLIDMAQNVAPLVDFECAQAHRARDRVAAECVAMPEGADLAALAQHRLVDHLRDQHRRKRRVGRGERLGDGNQIGLHAEGLRAEHIAGAREPADDFIVDQQDVVFRQHRLNFFEIGGGRNQHAARAHHRLGDEGGDGVGVLALNHGVEIVRKAGGEVLLALAILGVAVVMRAIGMQGEGQGKVEIAVNGGQAGQAAGRDSDTMIGLVARNDALLLRLAARIVVIPDELDLGVVGFRAGARKQHLGDRGGCDLLELLGERDARLVALARELVLVGQAAHLIQRGADQFVLVEPQRGAPQSRQSLDIGLAEGVINIDSLAALKDQRPGLPHCIKVGVGMNERCDVAGGDVGNRGEAG